MTNAQSRLKFLASDELVAIRETLLEIAADPHYNTESVYTTAEQPESSVFVEKHVAYMSNNLNITPDQYLSNLRLRTRIRK